MNKESVVKLKPRNGKEEQWPCCRAQFILRAQAKGYRMVLEGLKEVLDKDENFEKIKEPQKLVNWN